MTVIVQKVTGSDAWRFVREVVLRVHRHHDPLADFLSGGPR